MTLNQAKDFTQDMLVKGVISGLEARNHLIGMMSFLPVNGNAYAWNVKRMPGSDILSDSTINGLSGATKAAFLKSLEVALGNKRDQVWQAAKSATEVDTAATDIAAAKTAAVAANNTDVTPSRDGTIADAFTTVDRRTAELTEFALNAPTSLADMSFRTEQIDPRAVNIMGVVDLIADRFTKAALSTIASDAVTLERSTSGSTRSLGLFDQALDELRGSGQKVIITSFTEKNLYLAGIRKAGGASMTELRGEQVPMYNGVPILAMDFMPASAFYAVNLSPADGFHGITSANNAGVTVKDLGLAFDKNNNVDRVTWFANAVNKSEGSIWVQTGLTGSSY